MKICIPTEDDRGLDAALAAHFGRAPFFTVVDPLAKTATVIPNRDAEHGHGHGQGHGHEHGHCNPLDAIRLSGADVVVCRGLGRNALIGLQRAGVPVFTTDEAHVLAAVRSFEARGLPGASLTSACGGSGDCHGQAHDE